MLDFGFSEILLTSAIALVVLGPERLPKVARQVGNWMGRARAMARQLSEQLEREVDAEALLKDHSKPKVSMARLPPLESDAPPQYIPPAVAPQYMASTAPVAGADSLAPAAQAATNLETRVSSSAPEPAGLSTAVAEPDPPLVVPQSPLAQPAAGTAPAGAPYVQTLYDAPSNGSGHADYEPPAAGIADPAHRSP